MSDMAMEEQQQDKTVRIFVGGLAESVTAEDLRRLFGSLGTVEGVETIRTKGRSFAYVDFIPSPTDEKSLSKLFSKYNGCLWKGGKLKLEKAKEHYIARLKREWVEDAAAEIVSSKPETTNIGADKLNEKSQTKESLKTKQLHIYFPRLRKVKSIPFTGTGKHKYSFQNIKVPPLPVHFCDCEEHCSPSGTERGKPYFDRVTENGGMNDEEINIMNSVMNKLLEKEKVSSEKHLEKEQDSFESPDALHSDECEIDSATDEDDLIINMDTKKNKSALIGSQELERILENQESWLNKTRVAEEELEKNTHDMHNSNSKKKRKSLPTSERESSGHVSTTAGGKSSMQIIPEKLGSGAEPSDSEGDFGESTKVSWFQKSSWKKLLGDGGNTAFSASLILPKFNSGEEQQISDSKEEERSDGEEQQRSDCEEQRSDCEEQRSDSEEQQRSDGEEQQRSDSEEHQISDSEEHQISDSEEEQRSDSEEQQISDSEEQKSDGEEQRKSDRVEQQISDCEEEQISDSPSPPIHTEDKTENTETDEYLGNKPTDMDSIKEPVEAYLTDAQVMEEHAEAHPTGENVAPNKTGRGAAWRHKQSWTQLVSTGNNSFSISQILPDITFPEPMTKQPTMDPANSDDQRRNAEAKDTINEVVSDGFDLGKMISETRQQVGTNDIASAPKVEKKIETRPREGSSEETIRKERFTSNVEIGETCSFMRSSASLKEWAKARTAMSGSLKRKRGEKKKEH